MPSGNFAWRRGAGDWRVPLRLVDPRPMPGVLVPAAVLPPPGLKTLRITMKLNLDPNSLADYRTFIAAKGLPRFRCVGRQIEFPDEYASMLGLTPVVNADAKPYKPMKELFDYQRDIAKLSIRKKKFCVFAQCGLGKDLMMKEAARYASESLAPDKKILMMEPLNCIGQSLEETERWYGKKMRVEQVKSKNLNDWLMGSGGRIGICNYDALNDETPQGNLGALLLNESSVLKSSGTWARATIRMGAGLEFKWAYTGTPAPNDRIEYANHAVFMDAFPTVNSFLARYFVNKGQTQERWILKPHSLAKFYREISHWCIFLENPATYGFKDNTESIPPINVHIHEVDLTGEQREAVYEMTGKLFMDEPGGITTRAKLSQIGKGSYKGESIESLKPEFISNLVQSWPTESTIIWCHYNDEQDGMERLFPDAASIAGKTKHADRVELIRDFQQGKRRILISKGEILGFGLNLQIATRHVFSGLQDSYEEFHQCVKRSNRIGSTIPLNVHIPCTEIERPMINNVLEKAHCVEFDTAEQERIFKESGVILWD